MAEVTQSEIGQKQKLQAVLEAVQDLLRPHGRALQWTVDCEHPGGGGRAAGRGAQPLSFSTCHSSSRLALHFKTWSHSCSERGSQGVPAVAQQ